MASTVKEMGIILKVILLKLVIFTFFVHFSSACIEASSPVRGNMTKDYDLLVGRTLNVQCNLFSHNVTLNGTHYHVTSDNLIIKFGKSIVEDLVRLDPLTVSYTVENSTVNDTGIYTCYLSLPELSSMIFVCTSYIAVGYTPRPIEDFSCIGLHYKNLTCSWAKPFNPVKTNYEIWDYFQFVALKRRCPVMLNSTTCQWRLDSYPPYRKSAKTLYFLLVGNNTLGVNRQSIIIDHFKFVKPAHVQKLHFSSITKKSIVVNWSAPSGMEYNDFPPGLLYSIKYCPVAPIRKSCTEVESTGGLTHLLIENLVPFTEYEFKVRCRSTIAESEDMWSETVGLSAKTLQDVPYLAPKVTFSSYEVKTILGNRSITLFWKAIPAEYQNGKDLHYVIQYHIHYVRTKRENLEVEVGNVTSYTFRHMDLNTAYLFKIYARNNIGPSLKSSVIIVDKTSKLLSAPRDFAVLSHGRGNYTVSWTPSPTSKSYTLFWCQEIKPWPFKCEGPLQWMHTTDTYHELNLYDKDTNFQFAVSSNDGEQTSGMKWATCFVPYSGVLYKVKSVNLTPKNSTSIEVQWTLDCDAQRAVIKEYAINYCTCASDRSNVTCTEPAKRVNISQALQDQYIIGSLKPYTCYRILVRARTEDGWSEDSDPMFESTLPSAPSDSPRNAKVVTVNDTTIQISFQKPQHPNGKITRYEISYGKTPSYPNTPKHHQEFIATEDSDVYNVEITRGIYHYTNYSIEVAACVDKACSPLSKPVYALTGIGNPGIMDSPHIQIINSSFVNITWKPPIMPNGPIELYQVAIRWKEGSKDDELNEINEIYNVSGSTYLSITLNCPVEIHDETMYFISVRALNMKDGVPLFGQPSKETQSTLCFAVTEGLSYGMVVGIAVGCAVGLVALVSIIYSLVSWMKTEVDLIKGINVQLPKGLDSPIENPLSSYDKFKKGLQKNHDNGTPYDRTYDRLNSFASEVEVKDTDGGIGGVTTEGLSQKEKREISGRNHSGESNNSGKCHDSISSSNTNKTHLSIDSGAEVDSPPSPDGFFSDTSSSNTTPRSYKPDLAIVKEGIRTNSKDSGLEKEDPCSITHGRNVDLPSKFAWYVKKKNNPYFNIQFQKCMGQMPPYSKFAVISPSNGSTYVRLGEQNLGLLDNHSLSNSEPSVADFEVGSDCEPLVLPGISPYSKFGLARSAGNGLNMGNQAIVANQNVGYAKFGIVYRALKCDDIGDKGSGSTYLPPELKTCPTFLPNHHAMPAVMFNRSVMSNGSKPNKSSPTESCEKMLKEDIGKAYSKFGVQQSTPKRNESHKDYVSFNEALNKQKIENWEVNTTQPPDMAYSKFSVSKKPEKENQMRSDSITSNTSDSPPSSASNSRAYSNFGFLPETTAQESGYVSFQEAKVMSVEHRPERGTTGGCQPCNTNFDEHISCNDTSIEDNMNAIGASECLNTDIDDVDSSLQQDSIAEELTNGTILSIEDIVTDDAVPNESKDMCNHISIDTEIPCSLNSDNKCDKVSDRVHPITLTINNEVPRGEQKNNEQNRLSKPRTNASCKLYVPLSELTKEPNISAHVITRPNIALSVHVENV